MANTHITAARECDQFKGNTRLLLFILADAAYDDKPRPKGLAPGWSYLDEVELQARMNTPRLSTVRECLKELVEAGRSSATVAFTTPLSRMWTLTGSRLTLAHIARKT